MSVLNPAPLKPTLTQVENAFQPAREVIAPPKFAGRKSAVQQAYFALLSEGAHIAVVGNRGIGKTSLGRQIINLASGDNDLLEKLSLAFDRKLDFLTVYLTCGTSIKDTTTLLERLLSSKNCLADWIYDIPSASKAASGYNPKAGGNIFGAELSLAYEKKTEESFSPAISEHQIDAVFTNVVSEIARQNLAPDGVLIVVDEFDQIGDPTGFASFLKSIATNVPKAKFCIIGVAQDIHNLMKEHQSSDRLFAGAIITLLSMDAAELLEIIAIAEKSIESYITFHSSAAGRLVELAHGQPYMVHLIGKYALRHAFLADQRQITLEMIEETLKLIAERQYDPVLEGRYKRAVASSEQRETVLRAMAESQAGDGEVYTTVAYKTALEQGVDNASQYVGQLVTEEYGKEIEKVRDRYYRFRDALFTAYIRARPRLVLNADPPVDDQA
jgi:ABC-type dipeptide/oligopeptide/nickel transport system ATPase component